MNKISGIVITYNEEKNIERCLQSMTKVCDEIIIVDSFSTDKTEQICKHFTEKFSTHKFEGYRDQKNYATELAFYDFVLSLDADEVLSDDLIKIILLLKNKGLTYDAYKFNRLNHIGLKPIKRGDWYPDSKIRLWNKNKGKWAGKNVHETVKVDKGASVMYIKKDILHFPYNSISKYKLQHVKFAEMWAIDAAEEGKKSNLIMANMKAAFKFFKGYILKLGFLDGLYGFTIAKSQMNYTLTKYLRLAEINKTKKMDSK